MVVHVLHKEGVVPVFPLHLRMEHGVFHIRVYPLAGHVRVVLLVAVARVRDYLFALPAVSFPERFQKRYHSAPVRRPAVDVAHIRIHDHFQEHTRMETARPSALVGRLYPRDVKPAYYRADCPYGMIFRNKFTKGYRKKETVVLIAGFIYYFIGRLVRNFLYSARYLRINFARLDKTSMQASLLSLEISSIKSKLSRSCESNLKYGNL